MSEYSSFEMGSVDRPPNRFQVNPVNHKNNNDKGPAATPAEDVPHEVYRRLTGLDGEPLEDDQFNEDAAQMLKAQQQPRTQR